jgi:Tol biopolymer transport system component
MSQHEEHDDAAGRVRTVHALPSPQTSALTPLHFLRVLRAFVSFVVLLSLITTVGLLSVIFSARAAPPSDEIAYVSGFRAYRHDLAHGIRHRLRTPAPLQLIWLVWSPDGAQLALTTCVRNRPNIRAQCALETTNAMGGSRRIWAREGFGMAWLPDGNGLIYLVLYPFPGLYTVDLTTERVTPLASGGMNQTSLTLSPDGIFLTYTDVLYGGTNGSPQIYALRTADAPAALRSDETRRDRAIRLTNDRLYDSAWNDNPMWSPDGTRIAYLSTAETFDPEIYVMDVRGLAENASVGSPVGNRRTACGDAVYHVWSDDGARLAYICNGDHSVRVVNAAGDAAEQIIARPVRAVAPIWSYDGRALYVVDRDRYLARVVLDGVLRDPASARVSSVPIIESGEGGRMLMRRPGR